MNNDHTSSGPSVVKEELDVYSSITPPDSTKTFLEVLEDVDFIKLTDAQLSEGDLCFDFKLPLYNFSGQNLDKTADTFHLSQACTKQPVALVFGSYTCGVFRRAWPSIHDLWKTYGEQITFVAVYIAEMHPTDGWETIDNRKEGILYSQPTLFEQREALAEVCVRNLSIEMPVIVDEMSNRVTHAYGGLPNRLYLIGTNGKIAYQGESGPTVNPEALEAAIKDVLA